MRRVLTSVWPLKLRVVWLPSGDLINTLKRRAWVAVVIGKVATLGIVVVAVLVTVDAGVTSGAVEVAAVGRET